MRGISFTSFSFLFLPSLPLRFLRRWLVLVWVFYSCREIGVRKRCSRNSLTFSRVSHLILVFQLNGPKPFYFPWKIKSDWSESVDLNIQTSAPLWVGKYKLDYLHPKFIKRSSETTVVHFHLLAHFRLSVACKQVIYFGSLDFPLTTYQRPKSLAECRSIWNQAQNIVMLLCMRPTVFQRQVWLIIEHFVWHYSWCVLLIRKIEVWLHFLLESPI